MTTVQRLLSVALGIGLAALGDNRPNPLASFQVAPQAMPTTLTNISTLANSIPPAGIDIYVCHLDLAIAPNSGTVDVTIKSAGTSPVFFWNAVPMTSSSATEGSAYNGVINTDPANCVFFPRGMAVLASGAGVTISSLSGKY